ncbi:hypothetical protein RQP46_007488 [Phenoliferia psychrophenolica]
MSHSTTETISEPLRSLSLRPEAESPASKDVKAAGAETEKPYKYARFLPSFDAELKLPPLVPFTHTDPGHAALTDPTPRSFLDSATTAEELTPDFGSEVAGVQLHLLTPHEEQPPGLTTLFLFDSPPSGGDTGYADQRGAYNHLSPNFRAYLETLSAVHSGVQQAELSRKGNRGGVVKREPVENVHPVVRTHPALFVNPQFTRRIVGLKIEESDAILNLLYAHIAQGADFQVRLRWRPKSVVLWDNRITAHSAIVDFSRTGGRRHGARITPQAEKPFFKA